MARTLGFALAALASAAAWGQSAAASGQSAAALPAFEVATIKPSKPSDGRMFLGMNFDAGRVTLTNTSLKELVAQAYSVKDYQITGPDWMEHTRYDIVAKLPDGAPHEKAREMLQTLL